MGRRPRPGTRLRRREARRDERRAGCLRGLPRRVRGRHPPRGREDRAHHAAARPPARHRLPARHACRRGRLLAGPPAPSATPHRAAGVRPVRAHLLGRGADPGGRRAACCGRPLRARGGVRLHRSRQLRARPQRDVRAGGDGRVVGERGAVPVRLAQHGGRRVALLRVVRADRAARLLRHRHQGHPRGRRGGRSRARLGREPDHGFGSVLFPSR